MAAGAEEMTHPPVSMTTADPTGSWLPTGAAVADLTNAKFKGQPISVTPGAGALGNVARVATGRSDLGLSYGPFLKLATQGGNEVNEGEGYTNLRAIMAFTAYPLHILVDDDVGVASLDELKDKYSDLRIVTGQTGSSNFFIFNTALECYGITFDEVEGAGGAVSQTNWAGMSDAWKNRQINIMSMIYTPPHPSVEGLMGVRYKDNLPSRACCQGLMADQDIKVEMIVVASK